VELEKTLYQHFQFSSFRNGQKEVIQSVLSGQNTIAMLPTGTGKSLCYQLPGYLLPGKVVIVSPLLSLMQDQVEQMKSMGEKRAIAINSFLTPIQKRQIILRMQRYKFIFVSPEMLRATVVLNKLKEMDISLFVVDEAHCISQWGYDFRPDYLKVGEVRNILGNPLTIALTATATKEVRQDIAQYLHFDLWEEYVFSVDRPEIFLELEKVSYQEKQERAIELATNLQGPGIMYFSSKKLAEQMADQLRNRGERAMAYHGGLDHESRILIQQQFIHDQIDIVCATSAFGMGINKENIRYVIHFHMPLQLESYLQEIGRAGRDGKGSLAVLLYSPGDEQLSFQLAEGELPEDGQVDRLFTLMRENQIKGADLQIHEEWLVESCGFTETQWRITESYIGPYNKTNWEEAKQQLKQYVAERIRIKKRKINQMLDFLYQNSCKRTIILRYFGEPSSSKKENCCSYCGSDITQFKKKTTTANKVAKSFNWKNELASMLLKQVGDADEERI
jgi:ATP-dependent DNA helicase RecQ